jgi:hypothetical protein
MRHKRFCYERVPLEEAAQRYVKARRKGRKIRMMIAGALADEIISREKEKKTLTLYFHKSIVNVWRQFPNEIKHQVTADLERVIFMRGVDEGIVTLKINPEALARAVDHKNDESQMGSETVMSFNSEKIEKNEDNGKEEDT